MIRLLLLSTLVAGAAHAQDVDFNRDVRPLLSDRCFHCHGPDGHDRKADLRLDRPDGDQGAYRTLDEITAIVPGKPEESEVWLRLTTDDEGDRMPPVDSHKTQLTASERDIFKRWIEQGAQYDQHWAFVTPAGDGTLDIDARVREALGGGPARPAPETDRRTLLRRVTLDITGLPPTRQQIAAFLQDDSPEAYGRVVDRLLDSPHYGEHMARYWLDLVRFADTNGIHHDHYRDLSTYRDWVIQAFNENLGYDDFVIDQIAGDLHDQPTTEQQIASGFNRLHLIIDRGTALPEESFARNVIDRVTAVGTAFMGLTVGCAVCHDHKYDPISQKDFYRLYAFFNNIDAAPETGGRSGTDFRRGLQKPYIEMPTARQEQDRAAAERAMQQARAELDAAKKRQNAAKGTPEAKQIAAEVKAFQKTFDQARQKRDRVAMSIGAAMVMKERAEVRPAHVMIRGQYDNLGDVVTRGTPEFLPPLEATGTPTRMDLARWLVREDHPLTARVAVNRIWQQFFGVGLVKTAEDFGLQGESPSHPKLLDDLTVHFMKSGWDVKALIKQIVLSKTYRQSSAATSEAYISDPENRTLARGPRFRLDAEVVRDQILASSGLLNDTLFGKSVKPPQPPGLWKAVALPSSFPRTYQADKGDAIYRRSLYTFWKRGLPPPQMTILNAPTRESCIARRERTNTPLQALLLLNETEYLRAARHLAARILRTHESDAERLDVLFETITAQLPGDAETKPLLAALTDLRQSYEARPELAAELCEGGDNSSAELAAWTVIVNAIYNLDITKTKG